MSGGGEFGVADDGTVVFCSSGQEADVAELLQDTGALIAQFDRDRSAKGFTWVVPEVAPGFHEVVVRARLDVHTESGGDDEEDPGVEDPGDEEDVVAADQALGVFGKRLLVIERTAVIVEEQDQGES